MVSWDVGPVQLWPCIGFVVPHLTLSARFCSNNMHDNPWLSSYHAAVGAAAPLRNVVAHACAVCFAGVEVLGAWRQQQRRR